MTIDLAELLTAPPGTPAARRCLVIGEVAQAHDGSLGMAHAYIDAIADAGAHAVKFQTHIAFAESSVEEPWRVKFSLQDETRYEYWRRMEFTEPQWAGLQRHAAERGLLFLSSPFSEEAVALLTRVGVAGWKVASGEMTNRPMFAGMAATGLPFLVSTGMSHWREIDAVVAQLRETHRPFAVMQCTSAYPCPPEKVGLNLVSEFQRRYRCPVGLSDHSGTIFPSLAAVTLGARIIEVHVTFSRQMFGPDVVASLTTSELKQLVEGVKWIEAMQAHPVDKDQLAQELGPLRGMFTKSIVTRTNLDAGTKLERHHLTTKKPGTGIPADRLDDVLNRRLKRAVTANTFLKEEDLDG